MPADFIFLSPFPVGTPLLRCPQTPEDGCPYNNFTNYAVSICKPDLHSIPELYDNTIVWPLYENAYIQAWCNNGDATIEVISSSMFSGSLMHWHPEEEDMVNELYRLGKKGNLLVLKKSLLGTSTFYIGPSEDYPHPDRSALYFGKKKWDGGMLVFFEQNRISAE